MTGALSLHSLIFLSLVGLTALQRALELKRSNRNRASMRCIGFSRVDSQRSYLTMVAVHTTWFIAMLFEHLIFPWTVPSAIMISAIALFGAAQALRAWSIRALGAQWNTQVMSPTNDIRSMPVVSHGPYRFIRHPNYLAVIIEFLTLPICGGAVVTAVLWSGFNGLVLKNRIKAEELHLRQREGYEATFADTPCLIPRLGRKHIVK